MRSSETRARRLCLGLAVCGLVQLSGCAMPAAQLALRQRLEAGVQTPEDMVRFRTPPAVQERLVASGQEWPGRWPAPAAAARSTDAADALLNAATAGDLAAARAALLAGAPVNAGDAWGTTPLQRAAAPGHVDMVRLLLRAGADANGRSTGLTPLAAAALGGHTGVVRLLLASGARTDTSTDNSEAPLVLAVRLNRLESAAALLDAGASLRVSSRQGDSLCMLAITENYPAMLELLLRKGANPHAPDRDGLLPLYWAHYYQRDELARLLLAAGADPQRQKLAVPASGHYALREF